MKTLKEIHAELLACAISDGRDLPQLRAYLEHIASELGALIAELSVSMMQKNESEQRARRLNTQQEAKLEAYQEVIDTLLEKLSSR